MDTDTWSRRRRRRTEVRECERNAKSWIGNFMANWERIDWPAAEPQLLRLLFDLDHTDALAVRALTWRAIATDQTESSNANSQDQGRHKRKNRNKIKSKPQPLQMKQFHVNYETSALFTNSKRAIKKEEKTISKTIKKNENIKKWGKNTSAIENCGKISLIFEAD